VIHAWEDFAGFDTQHYRDYNYGIGNYDHGHSIVMPTEFLHGMYDGGHGAGLEDYWEHMWATPLCAGGFLWDFVDQGIVRTDKNGILDTDGNRAADGIVDHIVKRKEVILPSKKFGVQSSLRQKKLPPILMENLLSKIAIILPIPISVVLLGNSNL
jgi:hypothetical protein